MPPPPSTHTYQQTHPLAMRVIQQLHTHIADSAHKADSSHRDREEQQEKQTYSTLALIHHHLTALFDSHAHLFPLLSSLYLQHDCTQMIHSQQGTTNTVLGVEAADMERAGEQHRSLLLQTMSAGDEGQAVNAERRLFIQMMNERLTEQLNELQTVWQTQTQQADRQEQRHKHSGKENINSSNNTHAQSSLGSKDDALSRCSSLSAVVSASLHKSELIAEQEKQQATARYTAEEKLCQLQCELLDLYITLIETHRLDIAQQHDAELVARCLTLFECMTLKLQLLETELKQPQGVSSVSMVYTTYQRMHELLQQRLSAVEVEVSALQRKKAEYDWLSQGDRAAEWEQLQREWKALTQSKQEKQWTLKQLK